MEEPGELTWRDNAAACALGIGIAALAWFTGNSAEVPPGVLLLTMGMDTQDNRLEYEVVGWDRNGQSWGISRGVIPGRPDAPGVWQEVDALLDREWKSTNGIKFRILATFIDSGGHFTTTIYKQCARRASKKILFSPRTWG